MLDLEGLNTGVLHIVRDYSHQLDAIKNDVLYFVMLPLRIGLLRGVTPYSWGFALTPGVIAGYVVLVLAIAGFLGYRFGWRPALAMIAAGTFYFEGFIAFSLAGLYHLGHDSGLADGGLADRSLRILEPASSCW